MNFAKNLKIAMEQRGYTQKNLVELTGISKSAISLYLAGKRTPEPFAQEMLAGVLDVSVEWLNADNQETEPEIKQLSNSTETKVSILEAATRLGTSTNSIRAMLQQNRAKWGIAWITSENNDKPRWGYHISRSEFNAYLGTE